MVIQMIIEGIIFSLISLIVLFILTKMMGYRQVTQLSMYDYIIGISIGSIAAEILVLETYTELIKPLTGMIIYCLFTICLSFITRHSSKARHIIEGNPIILYEQDKIISHNLSKAKMDINEFLMELRIQGYFDLTQLDMVILETNGKISIFPKAQYRPVIIDDINIKVPQEQPLISLIINGEILMNQLVKIHKDKKWLLHQLKVKGFNDYKELILVLYNGNDIYVYKK